MERFGLPGSIILIASMSGTITNPVFFSRPASWRSFNNPRQKQHWVAYNTSKSAVLQMGRSLACELGVKSIRVNTISPGYIYTKCVRCSNMLFAC